MGGAGRARAAAAQDTRTVVGKVELIFACVLHTVSLFFYLLIFNVRAPAAGALL